MTDIRRSATSNKRIAADRSNPCDVSGRHRRAGPASALGKEELHGHATIDIFDIRPKGSGAPA
ncbi:hypothetical protein Rleg4DRAFT_6408 [Rhizobium leguminosarum bv. trifolii WSM2297]|uniref:Uncharacterized protein n=1 Tax=Rhizobium leguminosarum bv. trifolii WSM2297 TaxID=754762 RepID=J0L0Y8_RHILT|nr:hypothetical protein Rleg4DRAFT_5614 [Rhizobium leguminosarum bv. trifolii WSM2297]EJC84580.1 hypothetical protein Rleg4DRAFT_6408 [Rhizobium leguminosarum bv. trifolii WSM2297]